MLETCDVAGSEIDALPPLVELPNVIVEITVEFITDTEAENVNIELLLGPVCDEPPGIVSDSVLV